MKIGIIGGSGSTGSQFVEYFSSMGVETIPIGRKTPNYQEAVESCNVIIISVPIDCVEKIIDKISKFKLKGKLVINFASIMSRGWDKLKKLKCDVCCIHPMFGPQVKDFLDQNIIVAPEIENKFLDEIVGMFEESEANVEFSTVEEHDKLMAVIQALSQFSSITLASTLSKLNISLDKLVQFSSITFRMNLGTIKRILSQDTELWRNIQFLNPYFSEVLEAYEKEVKLSRSIVEAKDSNLFDTNFILTKSKWDKKEVFLSRGRTTTLMVEPEEDKPGVLVNILKVFSDLNVNLIKIKSSESRNQQGSFLFKIVIETKDFDIIREIKKRLAKIRVTLHVE